MWLLSEGRAAGDMLGCCVRAADYVLEALLHGAQEGP